MIASLPMYDMPETAAANDRLWQGIRAHYGKGPMTLDRDQDPHKTWVQPDLILSQTCGLPYRSALHGKVQLVGTPDYGVEGCPPGYYCSYLIVRNNDRRACITDYGQARFARNDQRSQSGWAALVYHFEQSGLGSPLEEYIRDTGSHAASMSSVADGDADIAAIDAVTWELHQTNSPDVPNLRILNKTVPTPGLPFITGPREDAEKLFEAVKCGIADLNDADRACLLLRDVVKIPAETYLAVPSL